MTDFTKLIDWINEAYPAINYVDKAQWIADIKADFQASGHVYPDKRHDGSPSTLEKQLDRVWRNTR